MKVVLWIFGILFVLLLIVAGAGYWWWQKNAAGMIEAGKLAMEDGHKRGMTMEESGCVTEAVSRHKAEASPSIGGSVKNGLFLRGCLDASKPQAKFCEGVPAKSNAVQVGLWAGQICQGAGLNDPYCPSLMQQVAEYCASPKRTSKL
jgi:hypothetical protein